MTMVIGLYRGMPQAQTAMSRLVYAGYALDRVSVVVRVGEASPVPESIADHVVVPRKTDAVCGAQLMAAGPLAAGAHSVPGESGLCRVIRILSTAGMQNASARFLADAITAGGVLVAVHCEDRRAKGARRILDAHADRVPGTGAPVPAPFHVREQAAFCS